ncbi:hypothetical protein BU26DRAFT_436374 [Trematosphaeria pertusa]|uniref:MFS general substrate transporter n=1 Tax=Trematosphaeria pertusa TaxID=390896 RepID=A0A6A6I1S3_9PLEO|nr:uncharacterized protein BU26DRAFT_436374 [Trematosphaeria pertusa]KAF2243958.1 hypothetical protein BU26DRAFT_436374 [Trematosphaeria pertusa]
MAFPAQWLYQRARWRATIFLAGFAVTACQIALHYCKQVWLLILVQGGIMGLALGILRGMVLLCLASHYKNNVPLASMQSGTVAMFGAFFYSFIAWTCLRSSKHLSLCWMNTVLSGTTLLLAFQQVRKSKGYKLLKPSDDPPRHRILKEKGMLWFLGGYFLLFSGFFVWPTFTVLLVSSPPSNHFPDFGAYVLFITFGCAMVTANYFVRPYSRRLLGPINAYVPFAMVAGVGYIVPAWMPSFLTAATCGVAYGCALGPLLALHIKVLTVFHWSGLSYHPAMVSRINLVSTLAGISAAAGICATAILADARGFGVALTVMGGLMVLGGVLMGIVRFVRCKEFFVAV